MGPVGKGKLDAKRKGHISESATVTRFLQCGYAVLTPFGGSERYDLVIEDAAGQFWMPSRMLCNDKQQTSKQRDRVQQGDCKEREISQTPSNG